jgi:hypothetical protein
LLKKWGGGLSSPPFFLSVNDDLHFLTWRQRRAGCQRIECLKANHLKVAVNHAITIIKTRQIALNFYQRLADISSRVAEGATSKAG